jgi:hypothetical protein
MKKIFFMLVSFLCLAFAAQAQTVTDLSQLSNDKVYTLRSERCFLLSSLLILKYVIYLPQV